MAGSDEPASLSVAELESAIRDEVNRPRLQYALISDSGYWEMICSALDVIGDTALATRWYRHQMQERAEPGELYVLLYGILQILFVQQDAVSNLADALKIDNEINAALKEIRDLRNRSVGHPTKIGPGEGRAFNFITRRSMYRSGFDLLTISRDEEVVLTHVDVEKLIGQQEAELRKTLCRVLAKMRADEMEHRSQFRDSKLAALFSADLRYYFEKVEEAIEAESVAERESGVGMLDVIWDDLRRFRTALADRGILEAYNVEKDIEEIEYPLSELRLWFQDPEASKLNRADVLIFSAFARLRMGRLAGIARDLDRDYATDL